MVGIGFPTRSGDHAHVQAERVAKLTQRTIDSVVRPGRRGQRTRPAVVCRSPAARAAGRRQDAKSCFGKRGTQQRGHILPQLRRVFRRGMHGERQHQHGRLPALRNPGGPVRRRRRGSGRRGNQRTDRQADKQRARRQGTTKSFKRFPLHRVLRISIRTCVPYGRRGHDYESRRQGSCPRRD